MVLLTMWSNIAVLFGGLLPALSGAQTFVDLPTGTSLTGDYSGHWRPQIHFSAPQGFINDPNGMFLDANGTYHLYYQYNPTGTVAGNQHWGHATSRDLYTWENQPIALAPTPNYDCFTGSAVVDVNNTSGFFPNQTNGVIAIYTQAGKEQAQGIAYSFDDGWTFTNYANNPVISIGSTAFRDPKVIWYEDHWVMVVAHATEYILSIYTSNNTIDWTLASNFSHYGLLGLNWECPNLLQMRVEGSDTPMWLLYLSIQPGAPVGGSIGQYFIGDFNGTHFTPVDNAARIADYGKDNYATQFFYNIPDSEDPISIAWASNWQYCNLVPTGPAEGWQSTMSLPRRNFIKNATQLGYVMASLPYGLDTLRESTVSASSDNLGSNGTLLADLSSSPSGAFLIDVNVTNFNSTGLPASASINFTLLASGSGESITGGTFLSSSATAWVDRTNIRGFDNPYNVGKFSGAFILEDTYDFQVVVDRSIFEFFSNGGEASSTLVFYPESMLDTVVIRAGGLNDGVEVTAKVYELAGTWPSGTVEPNGTDIYMGNSTSGNRMKKRSGSMREYKMPALPIDGRVWRG